MSPSHFDEASAGGARDGRGRDDEHRGSMGATFLIDTRTVEPKDRFDFWAAHFAAAPVPSTIERVDEGTFAGLARVASSGTMTVIDVTSSPVRLSRRKSDIRRGMGNQMVLALMIRGEAFSVADGDEQRFGPGDVAVGYEDSPFEIRHGDAPDTLVVKVSADRFRKGVIGRRPLLVSPRRSPYAAVAAAYMRALPRDAATLASSGDFLSRQLVALLVRATRDKPAPTRGTRGLFEAVVAVIEAEVADPDLSVGRLCTRLGVSRSTLYEAVAAHGRTVAGMILDRRLSGCLAELNRSGGSNTIAAISRRWGFRDQSSFNRAFRRRFGMTPTEWKGSGR